MLGRGGGKDTHAEQARSHQSAPLSSLKDPAQFAPPPKRLDYNKDPTSTVRARPTPVARPSATATAPTSNAATKPKPPPSLPPRLPPRQNSFPNEYAPSPPPTYNEATQPEAAPQGSLNRLGQAGVSVPGFGIGRNASPPVPPRQNSGTSTNETISPPAPPGRGNHMGELQSRFAKMSTTSSGSEAPTTGTSWADKQAALRTASSLREDPSKVSAADLKGAASTANNFQQRHGAQVASGWKAANGLNNKYGITGKVNSLASSSAATGTAQGQPTPPQSPGVAGSSGGIGKKAPPPPPPKKKELGGGSVEPPPIPLSSKPKF